MGVLDFLKKKKGAPTEDKDTKGYVDMRKSPIERKAIQSVVDTYNKDPMKPSARLTINETGKADVWMGDKKWAEYNHQGIVLKNADRYEEAIERFDAAIKEEPRVGIPHHGKAQTLFKMGDYEGALKEYNTAISLDKKAPEETHGKPLRLESYFGKIQVLMQLGEYEEMLDPEMKKYIMAREPQNFESGYNWAKEHLSVLDKLKNSAHTLTKEKKAKFNAQMEKAYSLTKLPDLPAALVEVEKAITMNPKDTAAHVTRGLIILGLKNTGQSNDDSEFGREIILAGALEPRNPNISFVSGVISQAGGEQKFALDRFIRVAFLDPDYLVKKKYETYRPWAEWLKSPAAYSKQPSTKLPPLEEKERELQKKLNKEVNEATLEKLRNGEISKKQQEEHMRFMEEMWKKQPTHFIYKGNKNIEEVLIRNIVLNASMLKDYEKAIKLSNEGLKINPKSAYLYYIKGRSQGDAGKYQDGLENLSVAIKLEPNFADAYVERGVIKRKLGKEDKAQEDFRKAKQLEPSIVIPAK